MERQSRDHPVTDPVESWTEADFVGGHRVLDLVNTVADTDKSRLTTRLACWEDFVAWMIAADRVHASASGGGVDVEPARRRRTLGRIHVLREHAFALLSVIARDGAVEEASRSAVERAIAAATRRASLHVDRSGGVWRATSDPSHHHVDEFALGLDALLRTDGARRLRECGSCTWLFLDRGRGVGRRWCDMRTCGNRAKARAFRERS